MSILGAWPLTEIETSQKALFAPVVAGARRDPAFRTRLLESDSSALAGMGIEPAPGVPVKVVEETPGILYLVLPALPTQESVGEDLDQIAGGVSNVGDLFREVSDGVRDLGKATKDMAVSF
ncbi:NHLP leader peptide family RiPP precursor [Xanthobacter flavus]|uniref:NHLP leader peptide family RiPP precursor n=1 Tax=Xanthobacter flavus TaxID=281 RepID=UPI003728BA63